MTFRSDISVDWAQSPRIVTVASPSTSVTIQDLHDTLRRLENRFGQGLPYPSIVTTAGKEALGGSVFVGLTMKMLNARLAFQGRKTSHSTGSITTADTVGITLTDSAATFQTAGVLAGATIINKTDGSRCTVLQVLSQTQLRTDGLGDGVDNQFNTSDTYEVQNVEQVEVSGGNLVAVDANGDAIAAILPTVGTQVVRTSSSSATLQGQLDIEYASFNGAVSVDLTSTYAGTAFPTGTPRQPVNNFADALTIANARGFTAFNVSGDASIDSGLDYSGKVFYGESQTKSLLTISSAALVAGCEFYDAEITGTLDGGARLKGCLIDILNYVDGFIEQCVLKGTIKLGGDAHFLDCWSGIPGAATPVLDFDGSAASLSLRNYNGGITLRNKSGAQPTNIDLNSGQVILESTVTAGTIIIRGVGKLTDSSIGATVDATHLLSPPSLADAVWDELLAGHATAGSAGKALADLGAGSGLTPTQATMLLEMYRLLGLDPTRPLVVTATTRKVPASGADISQTIADAPAGTITVTRI